MKAKEAVVKRVDVLCRQNTITYNELANRSGVTASTVYSVFDTKRKNISIATIQKICDGFDISLYDFFNDDIFKTIEQEIE